VNKLFLLGCVISCLTISLQASQKDHRQEPTELTVQQVWGMVLADLDESSILFRLTASGRVTQSKEAEKPFSDHNDERVIPQQRRVDPVAPWASVNLPKDLADFHRGLAEANLLDGEDA